jgi:hypothetical protein
MRTAPVALAAAAALVVLAGCSTSPSAPDQGPPPTTGGAAAASTSPTAIAGSSPGSDLGPVAGTRTVPVRGNPLTLELHDIVRQGTLAQVSFTVSAEKLTAIYDVFDDGNLDSSDKANYTADGLTLVDTGASKVYLVAADSQGRCLCSRQLVQTVVQDSQPVLLYATFAAPPATVTSMSVQVPGFGVFPDVPVR